MKATIKIEIMDNTTPEKLEKAGMTKEFIENLYEIAFRSLINEVADDGCKSSISVEVTDEVI